MSHLAASVAKSGPQERRDTERKHWQLAASVTLADGQKVEGQTVNLSSAGMSLHLPHSQNMGDECIIRLELSACGYDEPIIFHGRVCHCTKMDDGYRAGLQLVRMSAAAAQFLREILR